ncbi:MAG TPA: hypothetical protein VKL99_04055 [Candidatus Angelobacter sp.]|nr:hypothetical protein [Candidatus Angelobacter sp.]
MKSYWIVAAAFVLTAWPSSSKAYVAGMAQTKAEEKPIQQAPSPNSSATPQVSIQAQSGAASDSTATTNTQNKSSYLLVELSKTLKAKKLKPGDKIKAEVSQDVISHNKVIIPVETEVIGHVTEVNARGPESSESRLGIVFDRIVLKHFHDIKFQAVVQSVKPPVLRRSRVDEPSQMLPPSMVVGDLRQSSPAPAGRPGTAPRGATAAPPSTAMSESNNITASQAPLTVKQSPSTHTATGSSAASLETSPGATPLSVGMPQGVFGLKGLSLTSGATASTPGPVIISNTDNVKLESGTQILLHVLMVETPQEARK